MMSFMTAGTICYPIEYKVLRENNLRELGQDVIFWLSFQIYIQTAAELAFNTLMLFYLSQPYREAKAEDKENLPPSCAVKTIAGSNEFDNYSDKFN